MWTKTHIYIIQDSRNISEDLSPSYCYYILDISETMGKFRVRETEKSNRDFKGFLELYQPLDYEERNGYQIQLRAYVSTL